MTTLTDDQYRAMANAMDVVFPVCDGSGKAFDDGPCLENTDSGKGYVYYSDYERCQGSWILLPGFNLLPDWLLGIAYLLWLIWLFFGVAVISDIFVEAIEEITGTTKVVKRKTESGKIIEVEVPVWNWVVSNITLMALGSSSPEILLAVVETLISLGKPTEELGPSTIIGSGSFNLFAITAICTISLPLGVFKKIEHQKVFVWTTTWMLWAHIWLWMVYKRISPGEIEIWEAWLTLGFTPIFVYTSYLVDVRGWNWFSAPNDVWPDDDMEEGGSVHRKGAMTEEKRHSILYYRQLAVQQMKGNLLNKEHLPRSFTGLETPVESHQDVSAFNTDKSVQKVMFKSPHYSCLESAGVAVVQVLRIHGDMTRPLTVHYKTEDSSAMDGLDYEGKEGSIQFQPNEDMAEISIKIVDDDMSEPDVSFLVVITGADAGPGTPEAIILQPKVVVTIVDDDDGGILTFELPSVEAGMSGDVAEVTVVRRNGADGKVTIDYSTRDGSALAGEHYEESTGSLTFNAREIQKTIQIPILPQPELDPMASLVNFSHKAFKVCLTNPGGGATLGARNECRVILVPGSTGKSKLSEKPLKVIAKGGVGGRDEEDEEDDFWGQWRGQFREAIIPDFNPEDDDSVFMTCALHYINITWNLFAACIPPCSYKGGYLSFCCSLLMLGGLMAIVKEVGGLFGCSVGLSEIMTGISVVALGTSLPDTFASRMAAMNDDNADAAIGNVMGSNCVNVFLGLGIPWVIASAYKRGNDEKYLVSGGSLGFSLIIFFVMAFFCVAYLLFRRHQGGELGGERMGQWVSFGYLLSLWVMFLILSGLYDYGNIPETDKF